MGKLPERRRFHRFPFHAAGVLLVPNVGPLACELVDVSISGALVLLPSSVGRIAGRHPRLDLVMRNSGDSGEAGICVTVAAVWQSKEQLGCRFLGVDPESFVRLKALVEDHLGDPLLLDRELARLNYWPGVETGVRL